jgi:hypothetical protein
MKTDNNMSTELMRLHEVFSQKIIVLVQRMGILICSSKLRDMYTVLGVNKNL